MSQHPAYLPTLVSETGISLNSIRCVKPFGDGVTNRTSHVVLQDDTRFIFREYEWPYASGDNLRRLEKELYLHDLLLKYGVPVPAIVAKHEDGSTRAVLMEYRPGQLLGNVVDTLPEIQRAEAWRVVGAALRKVHAVQLTDSCAGLIVGERIQPFEEGSIERFGKWTTLR